MTRLKKSNDELVYRVNKDLEGGYYITMEMGKGRHRTKSVVLDIWDDNEEMAEVVCRALNEMNKG